MIPFVLVHTIRRFTANKSRSVGWLSFQNSSNSSESFCREWVQMRKYQACVFYMPILLRICRSESTHEMEKDSDELRKLK